MRITEGKLNLLDNQVVSNENKYAENDDIKINAEKKTKKKSHNCRAVNTLKTLKFQNFWPFG